MVLILISLLSPFDLSMIEFLKIIRSRKIQLIDFWIASEERKVSITNLANTKIMWS